MNEKILKTIPIHYDVDDHTIDLDVFIKAAKSIETIVYDLSEKLCTEKIRCSIVVIPPEEGTFKQKLGIIFAVGTIASTIINTEVGSGFIQGLTGKSTFEWAKDVGECLKTCVVSILEKKEEDLKEILPDEIDLSKSIKAKSEFYLTCKNNSEIKGIGFTDDDEFPIRSESFMNYVSAIHVDEKGLSPIYKLHHLTIVSPVLIFSNAKWRMKIVGLGEKVFNLRMDDEDFYKDVVYGKYNLKESSEDSTMDALIRYDATKGAIKYNELSISRVYRINKTILAKIPEGLEFEIPTSESNPDQLSLFDEFDQ